MNALAIVAALAVSAAPSTRLGLVALGPVTDPARDAVLYACPAVAVIELDLNSSSLALAYKTMRCPQTVVVLRAPLTAGVHYTVQDDPAASGGASATAVLETLRLFGVPFSAADWVTGPGPENLPAWTDTGADTWLARFWSRFADDLESAGWSPLVGAIAAGEPPLAGELSVNSVNGFAQTATEMKAKPYPWAWSYRAFAPALDTSTDPKLNPALRYRAIREECGLNGAHLVLEQAGLQTAAGKGWKSASVAGDDYLRWLHWLDMEARRDPEILGVAAFQFGDVSTWADFSLDELSEGFRGLLTDDSEPDAGTPGEDGGSNQGHMNPGDGTTTPVPPLKNSCGCSASGAVAPALGLAGLLALLARGARAKRLGRR